MSSLNSQHSGRNKHVCSQGGCPNHRGFVSVAAPVPRLHHVFPSSAREATISSGFHKIGHCAWDCCSRPCQHTRAIGPLPFPLHTKLPENHTEHPCWLPTRAQRFPPRESQAMQTMKGALRLHLSHNGHAIPTAAQISKLGLAVYHSTAQNQEDVGMHVSYGQRRRLNVRRKKPSLRDKKTRITGFA